MPLAGDLGLKRKDVTPIIVNYQVSMIIYTIKNIRTFNEMDKNTLRLQFCCKAIYLAFINLGNETLYGVKTTLLDISSTPFNILELSKILTKYCQLEVLNIRNKMF